MKATGIVRRIDDLGRIVIPKEIRRTMRIREGDPVEIYTENDGTVIFKKYSPIGELSEFANQYAEALTKTTNLACCISDTDTIIAVSGVPKKEFSEKKISSDVEKIMQGRTVFVSTAKSTDVPVTDNNDTYKAGAVAPIIFEGDSIGTVMLMSANSNRDFGDLEAKLAEVAAGFLSKTME